MTTDPVTIFRGNVRIYLQGPGALQPFQREYKKPFQYFVGTQASKILINDFRDEPIHAAVEKLSGNNNFEFADIFSQPASVNIIESLSGIEIELHDGEKGDDFPILWLGVIYDGKMPVRKITWEALKPIGLKETAFAVLVND